MASDPPYVTAGIENPPAAGYRAETLLPVPHAAPGDKGALRRVHRFLRATESEMGEIDRAALEELKHVRRFTYYTYDTTCLVEDDEEPPQPLNPRRWRSRFRWRRPWDDPVRQVHPMRKLVIDGSNTCGFQRTGPRGPGRPASGRHRDRDDLP